MNGSMLTLGEQMNVRIHRLDLSVHLLPNLQQVAAGGYGFALEGAGTSRRPSLVLKSDESHITPPISTQPSYKALGWLNFEFRGGHIRWR